MGTRIYLCLAIISGLPALDFPTAISHAQTNAPATNATPVADTAAQASHDRESCTRNLKIIYDAIQAYQMDHKSLPNWLSDLVPQYISDVGVFVCPVSRRTGETETSPLIDPKITSSYIYEFSNVPLGTNDVPDGQKATRREWKRRQMGLVGSIVPLVRCRLHSQVLNLSFDGRVYDSPAMWETLLTNQIDIAELTPQSLFARATIAKTNTPAKPEYPPRDPKAGTNQIDLAPYYNLHLSDFSPGRAKNEFLNLASNLQTFDGRQYDMRGVIQLRGTSPSLKNFPAEVKGIKIDRTCKELHFIHAAHYAGGESQGKRIGTYVVHFKTHAMQLEIPIIYGQDLLDWHELASEKPSPTPLMAWKSKNPVNLKGGAMLRFFETTWTNVAPSVEIKSIDFISAQAVTGPFLVAITAE